MIDPMTIRHRSAGLSVALCALALAAACTVAAAEAEVPAKPAAAMTKAPAAKGDAAAPTGPEDLRSGYHRVMDSATGDDLAPIAPMVADAATASDPLQAFLGEHMNRVVALRNEYVAALKGAGVETLLEPRRLDRDRDMAEGRRILAAARVAAQSMRAKLLALLAELPARVEETAMEDGLKQATIASIRSELPARTQQYEGQFALELKAYDEFASILDLLERAAWEFDGERIVFAGDADAEAYNAALDRIDAIVAEQEAFQRRALDATRRSLDAITR